MSEIVTLERPADGVALLTVTHREIENFCSFEVVDALAARMVEAREGGARVAVLASGLEEHWLEHAWLTDLIAMLRAEPTSGTSMGWFTALEELGRPEVVYIAAINGDCSGGGAELGWACDLRVAEEHARFSQPEVHINLATGIGGTCRLLRLVGPTVAAEMVLDGAPQTARRMYELGGINRVVGTGEATAYAVGWAKRLAARPADSLRVLKEMLRAAQNLPLDEAMANEQTLFQGIAGTPAALARMEEVQRRFDRGEKLGAVYGDPSAEGDGEGA